MMDILDNWADAVCAELGLDRDDAMQKTVLDLARVAAHHVDRPAAPLTAYFLGEAVGRGMPLAETAARLQRLARGFADRSRPAGQATDRATSEAPSHAERE
jgi:hypothetical protein